MGFALSDAQKLNAPAEPVSLDNKKYCFCKKHIFASVMVACDGDQCENLWYHLRCIGLEKAPRGA